MNRTSLLLLMFLKLEIHQFLMFVFFLYFMYFQFFVYFNVFAFFWCLYFLRFWFSTTTCCPAFIKFPVFYDFSFFTLFSPSVSGCFWALSIVIFSVSIRFSLFALIKKTSLESRSNHLLPSLTFTQLLWLLSPFTN